MRIRAAEGTSVLEASQAEDLEHAQACRGLARCTTCRVLVEDGLDQCPQPGALELEALSANGLEPPVRLACQLRPTGDVRVRILISSHEDPSEEPLGATEEHVAVLFADIRGFTTFAENRLPFDVSAVLNRYFDIMGVYVERHGGRILSYLGDGLVTLFRPSAEGNPCRHAVACALDMRRTAHRFGNYARDHFNADLQIGIAIHTGQAVIGDMGYFRNRQFNAVGDVLNVASRLEDLNKDFDTDILISREAAEPCLDMIEVGRAFDLNVRGRASPVQALEILGRSKKT